ncbi:MAG: M16 family metallopeptidase [Candidatus Aminicenantales bacterium]
MANQLLRARELGAGLLAALWLAATPLLAVAQGRHVVLDNGLQVFLFEKRDIPLVHIVTGFNVGSKDETDGTSGLVHLLEHCVLFRGTLTRSGAEVGADTRRHGAYFNGNTGQDLAVFEISLPAESADFGLRNQKDILFGLALSQADIDREKEIILEEYDQMEDDPERSAIDLVLQDLFPGHPYGRSIYGRREVVAAATAADLGVFYKKFFVADNCALAVVGDFAAADMESRIREIFGPLPKTGFKPDAFPMAAPLKKSSSRRLERDVRAGYLLIGFEAPDYNNADQYAMNVLVEALGRGVNPLLGAYLHGQRDSVQNVSMSYLAYRFGGAAIVSVKAEPKDLAAVERAAVSFLKRAHNESYSKKDFLSPEAEMAAFDYLEMAKNQIRFGSARAEESGLQLAGSLVRFMLLNTRENPGRYLDGIAKVDSGDLRRAASRYLGRGEYAAVSIVPGKEKK